MNYRECPYCGASLDAWDGECDCQKEEAHTAGTVQTSKINQYVSNYNNIKTEVCQYVGL